jgi:hypothetical protein
MIGADFRLSICGMATVWSAAIMRPGILTWQCPVAKVIPFKRLICRPSDG